MIRFALLCMLMLAATAHAAKHVVMFVADDLGSEALGCYGNAQARTPSVDALAAQATRFNFAFCTTASCSASRSVILTGLYNHANGQFGHAHSFHHFTTFAQVKALPVRLNEAGYRTARFGKFHVEPESLYGFTETVPVRQLAAWIKKDPDKPFFYYFCTTEPHRPFKHDPKDLPEPAGVPVPKFLPDSPESRKELAQYYASVTQMDRAVGALTAALKDAGVWDETLVLFLSDNGAPFPGAKTTVYEPGIRLPLLVKKPGQKQGGTTDTMVNWTDLAPTILDHAGALPKEEKKPTPALQGRSFLSAMDQKSTEGWDEIYASHQFHELTMYYPMRVVRTRSHKLIWNIASGLDFPFASDLWAASTWQAALKSPEQRYGPRSVQQYIKRPKFELYDLAQDPLETKNLADDPGQAKLLVELKDKLRAFQKRTDDPWISKWEYE